MVFIFIAIASLTLTCRKRGSSSGIWSMPGPNAPRASQNLPLNSWCTNTWSYAKRFELLMHQCRDLRPADEQF